MKKLILFLLTLQLSMQIHAQQTMPLYDGEVINSIPGGEPEVIKEDGGWVRIHNITIPTLTVYKPANGANGTAVIICPGGGYSINAIKHEGTDIAQKFNEQGVTAFVLKYRIPNQKTMKQPELGPLQDLQQAIITVRKRAVEWGVKPDRIGVMGFSAGGHLASTGGTHFTTSHVTNPGNISVRPDFMILVYPVISFQDSIAHMGSRNNLIGKSAGPEKVNLYSNELQVTPQTPATFLVHASDDQSVKSENSIVFYQALLKNKVSAELHIYQGGGHGFGLNNPTTTDKWFDRCIAWMNANHWLKP